MLIEPIFLVSLTNTYVGSFRDVISVVDNPISRNTFGIVRIPGEGLKGCIRSLLKMKSKNKHHEEAINTVFGTMDHVGAIIFDDACLIFAPTPTAKWGTIYVTSSYLLSRLANIFYMGGEKFAELAEFLDKLSLHASRLNLGESIVYIEGLDEDYVQFLVDVKIRAIKMNELKRLHEIINKILEKTCGPDLAEYINNGIIVLNDGTFDLIKDRLLHIKPRLKLKGMVGDVYDKTVDLGPWFEEEVPKFSIFVSSLKINKMRMHMKPDKIIGFLDILGEVTIHAKKKVSVEIGEKTIRRLLEKLATLDLTIGGSETTGCGIMKIVTAKNVIKGVQIPKISGTHETKKRTILALPSINVQKIALEIFKDKDVGLKEKAEDAKGKVSALPDRISKFGFNVTVDFYEKLKGEAKGRGYEEVRKILKKIQRQKPGQNIPENIRGAILSHLSKDIVTYLKYLVRSYAK